MSEHMLWACSVGVIYGRQECTELVGSFLCSSCSTASVLCLERQGDLQGLLAFTVITIEQPWHDAGATVYVKNPTKLFNDGSISDGLVK